MWFIIFVAVVATIIIFSPITENFRPWGWRRWGWGGGFRPWWRPFWNMYGYPYSYGYPGSVVLYTDDDQKKQQREINTVKQQLKTQQSYLYMAIIVGIILFAVIVLMK